VSPQVDVSLVVIAYNEATVITDCLVALRHQSTPRSLEILVVDDGSTDGTRALVEQIGTRDVRVRLIAHDHNRGRGASRRTGQDAALGPLIGFVDADVIVPPDWLERCAAALGPNGAVSGIATPDGDCAALERILHPVVRVRAHTMAISGGNVLFDARALREVGFDERARLGEDFRIARQLAAHGHPIATVPGLLAEHRESKSYVATIRWMWQNGVDAASLPFEFGIVRAPDLTWLAWIAVLVSLVSLAATGAVAWGLALGGTLLCTAAVAVGHTASRFHPRPRTLRWLAAALLDVPLVSAYLAGRTWGLPLAVLSARGTSRRPGGILAKAAPPGGG